MIKPSGALCNMNCSYCFFLHKQNLISSRFIMSENILERFVKNYLETQDSEVVTFTWQGGEPSLAGIDFFKKALFFQKKYCPPSKFIENDFQTNGLLLDDEWCRFLKDNNFLVGLSIDGPQNIHDKHRRDSKGSPTHSIVMKSLERLHHYEIPFNTLTAVTDEVSRNPLEVYRFLRDCADSKHIQFLPVVEPACFENTAPAYWDVSLLPSMKNENELSPDFSDFLTPWSVKPHNYGRFLCDIFDEWHINDIGNVYIYLFECLLGIWSGKSSFMCNFALECGTALALDHDGSIYFCDRFVYPDYRLGNIMESSLSDIISSYDNRTFAKLKSAVPIECKRCKWVFTCRGDCPKNRFLKTSKGELGLNYLCQGLSLFFEHVDPYLKDMCKMLAKQ